MEGRVPVTLQRLPQADAHFLLHVGRVDAVLAQPVALDQGTNLGTIVGQKLMQALAQGGVDTHNTAIFH
jgi:hypothetical protein